ncbi:MAG TPA: hypothetical protein VGG71_11335 [Chitinophagaceae bacterium]|jgi:hypothetical protein
MINSHPNEKEIQEYVLDKSSCPILVIRHIESCEQCQQEVKSYDILFTELKQEPASSFDFNLSELVLPLLPSPEPLMTTDRFIFGFLVVFACLCIGVPVYVFWQNILYMFNDIPVYFIYAIVASTGFTLLFRIFKIFKKYQNQMRILNFDYAG